MSKEEFLEKLSEALREYMDDSSAYRHISYYSSYIEEQKKKGYSEEEVIDKLGNPRLIAKSIIDSGNYAKESTTYATYDTRTTGDNEEQHHKETVNFYYNGKSINPLIGKIVAICTIILVIAVVCLVLWGISWLVLKVLLPLVLIIVLVALVVSLINSIKRKL